MTDIYKQLDNIFNDRFTINLRPKLDLVITFKESISDEQDHFTLTEFYDNQIQSYYETPENPDSQQYRINDLMTENYYLLERVKELEKEVKELENFKTQVCLNLDTDNLPFLKK